MDRVPGLDVARGAAVAMVVVMHLTFLHQCAVVLPQPVSRMALLLLISGALAEPALGRGWAYSRARAFDLLWLYGLWTVLAQLAAGGPTGLDALFSSLAAPNTPLWYIGGLALLTLSVPLLRSLSPPLVLLTAGGAMVWRSAGHEFGVLGYDQLMHFSFFFYLGLYGRRRLFASLARCGPRVGLGAAVAFVVLVMVPVSHTAVTIGAAAAVLLMAQGLGTTRLGPPLAWLGRHTLEVYLTHVPLLALLSHGLGPFGAFGLVGLVAATILLCLAARATADRAGLAWLYRRPRLTAAGRARVAAWGRGLRETGAAYARLTRELRPS